MGNERSPGEGPEGEVDAGDPTEEVGPEECEGGAIESEYKAGSIDESANATFPKFMDEVADAYSPEPGLMVPSPVDGLPIPADEAAEPVTAPPFTIDHVVCVEDDREFVEMLHREYVEMTKLGGHRAFLETMVVAFRDSFTSSGETTTRLHFSPDRVLELFGYKLVKVTNEEKMILVMDTDTANTEKDVYVFVRPLRERCKHYMRQILSHDGQPDPNEPGHRIIFRNCMIRRSVGGAFMGLRDEAVYACDYRDPPHIESVKKFLDDPDHEKLRSEAYKVKLPLFRRG